MRALAVVATALLGAAAPVPAPPPTGAATQVRYSAPVSPLHVSRGFAAPVMQYGPGHLGVDLVVPAHAAVHAAGPGVVSFAGRVAGRGVVVVQHPDGVRTEYEPLTVAVRGGATVTPATVLGHVTGGHGTCAADRCLHWGARRGDAYFDPLLLLRALGPVRLLPYP